MQFFVYVLESQATGRRYIGQTDDLERRLLEHYGTSKNPHRYTSKQAGPWTMIYTEEHPTRSEAMAREKWLKSGVGREWVKRRIGRASPPQAD